MRGEDVGFNERQACVWGSPPHARGRRTAKSQKVSARRITPACAGKTCSVVACFESGVDHPRMRGEDSMKSRPPFAKSGSPPHARGRPAGRRRLQVRPWITPACAGKTTGSCRASRMLADHPRMRGEDKEDPAFLADWRGSPPHARGRLWRQGAHSAPLSGSPPHARGRRDFDGVR